ncbi:transcription initiation factor IIE, beta subunit [Periconia macrospinosa]|uniref:Transcription initiation factor IIE subunit beta n=1 Tax=Periconia macrospinosa TaxID=97972 RepID=A0A2V1E774_9PLEO|nr:transcription initiation factor IIE, beta subunit [Periconia macrospinosa]
MSYLTTTSAPSPTPSTASTGGAKRKRPDDGGVVYSQPQETGTGSHIYTQLTYTIDYLKGRAAENSERWYTFKDLMDYLNVTDATTRAQLQNLYRSTNPSNRIAYNPTDNTYRYRPKYNIRNAAQLKAHFQSQKSALGLSVKDLKDGWVTVHDDLRVMEASNDVLVKRSQKDQTAITVWDNDPSLMNKMDPDFVNEFHKIQIPSNPDDLRNSLLAAGLQPSSAPRQSEGKKTDNKKRKKAVRRGGKQTNTHMASILKDFSHMRK